MPLRHLVRPVVSLLSVLLVVLVGLGAAPASAQTVYTQPTGRFILTLSATVVLRGDTLTVTITGGVSGATYTARVFSTPVDLGPRTADGSGTASWVVDTTALELGAHTAEVSGNSQSDSVAFEVDSVGTLYRGSAGSSGSGVTSAGSAASRSSGLAMTGAAGLPTLVLTAAGLLLVGVGGVVWGRRRRA